MRSPEIYTSAKKIPLSISPLRKKGSCVDQQEKSGRIRQLLLWPGPRKKKRHLSMGEKGGDIGDANATTLKGTCR